MTEPRNLLDLPVDLPVPRDDGACDHLPGKRLPSLALRATDGTMADLSMIPGRSVAYIYLPHVAGRSASADWVGPNPGARGCTAQPCAYLDLAAKLAALGVPGLRVEHIEEGLLAGSRSPSPPALSASQRRATTANHGALTTDVRSRWHDADQATAPRYRRRRD